MNSNEGFLGFRIAHAACGRFHVLPLKPLDGMPEFPDPTRSQISEIRKSLPLTSFGRRVSQGSDENSIVKGFVWESNGDLVKSNRNEELQMTFGIGLASQLLPQAFDDIGLDG